MKLTDLEAAIRRHGGNFHCERVHDDTQEKTIAFVHHVTPPSGLEGVPDVGRLRDLYETVGSVVFYLDEKSGDAARHLAPPVEWEDLRASFLDWLDDLDEDERDDLVPDWVDTCVVVGEVPHSGNYILVATEGPDAGRVFEFDHDGFEFTLQGEDMIDYVEQILEPDAALLTNFASHMRFIEGDSNVQWWIVRMKDRDGRTVDTES